MTSNLPNIPSTPTSSFVASRLAQAQGKPLPAGEAIASFVRHDDALAAFDVLSEQDYPVTALYLVNDGIRQVEYPVPLPYGRILTFAALRGAGFGAFFALLVIASTNDSSAFEVIKYVLLSMAMFVLWQMFVLRRSHGSRHPMRAESIPSRTVMYALPEYAQDARRVLGAHPRFSAAVAAARAAAAPEASQARAAQSTVSMNGAPVPTGAPKAPSYRAQAGSQPAPNQTLPERDTTAQNAVSQSAAQNMPAQAAQSTQPAEQASTGQVTAQKSDTQKRPAQRYGLRVDDPEEYAKLIQPKPQRPTPRPQGLQDKSSKDSE
ncbi:MULTISPECIES: hypothetical protein [Rothia]|jgi:hypothetical protein|uniref:Uncharacterized protein n=1 Tax=Rothia mucilaginosa (strain DY-18) TaxID=680646 RepID=D2NS21_ROTMD|nr:MULTISPECIES: hypothetical protein [Rothia]OFL76525.1 hypothetical protein HMPREF2749_05250 [Rothia sp. HMSC075F09]OFR59426.1 hypothetical protein HMPREF2879_03340 [Rothia sp. HMSC069C04]BAI64447.1 hypothetical protein RMDY18_06150 [Rothia mucilaginosa DY-18]